jgi:hypothetical protein
VDPLLILYLKYLIKHAITYTEMARREKTELSQNQQQENINRDKHPILPALATGATPITTSVEVLSTKKKQGHQTVERSTWWWM